MKADGHLIHIELPMSNGATYTSLCGKEIPQAKYMAGWDNLEIGVKRQLVKGLDGCCSKCKDRFATLQTLESDDWMKRNYVYLIRSARKDEEDSLEAA